ncbi:hypothetical protein [Aliarcobacter butzleri]|uniref:hypothetical protein n=1 Tax=Aliarcobacter butzleri TaxID=28197 RepID=UPI002B23FE2D|nr:hypothetical protein [Aliarcobacter butzleri]
MLPISENWLVDFTNNRCYKNEYLPYLEDEGNEVVYSEVNRGWHIKIGGNVICTQQSCYYNGNFYINGDIKKKVTMFGAVTTTFSVLRTTYRTFSSF